MKKKIHFFLTSNFVVNVNNRSRWVDAMRTALPHPYYQNHLSRRPQSGQSRAFLSFFFSIRLVVHLTADVIIMDYVVEPATNELVQLKRLTSSPSMYVRIKSWLLSAQDEGAPEEIRGNCVNQKVCVCVCVCGFFVFIPPLICGSVFVYCLFCCAHPTSEGFGNIYIKLNSCLFLHF